MLSDLRPLIVSGPSGSGKSSLINKLFEEYPGCFGFSVSHTTRQPRTGEKNGREYYFISKDTFQELIKQGEHFLEYTEFGGNFYGTSNQAVQDLRDHGKVCVLDVELNGVKAFRKSGIDARYVYIAPPSMEELRKRLELRGSETTESLEKRLAMAKRESDAAKNTPELYDRIIVNDDLDRAYAEFREFVNPKVSLS